MNLRWLWFDHFPPDLALSRTERAQVRRRAREMRSADQTSHRIERRFDAVFRPVALIGLGAVLYVSWIGAWTTWTWIGAAIAYLMMLDLVGAFVHYRTHAPFIRRALCEYGHEVCIDCGYLLLGLDDGVERCPECGAHREPMPEVKS